MFGVTRHFVLEEDLEKKKVEWTRKSSIRKEKFPAVDKTCKAMFWLTVDFKKE